MNASRYPLQNVRVREPGSSLSRNIGRGRLVTDNRARRIVAWLQARGVDAIAHTVWVRR